MAGEAYLTHCLQAKYQALGDNEIQKVKVGIKIVERRKGMFSSEMIAVEQDVFEDKMIWIPNGKFSDTRIDIGDLANRIQHTLNEYHKNGYELINIIELIEGKYKYATDSKFASAYASSSYGYSITDGVIMTFKRREVVTALSGQE